MKVVVVLLCLIQYVYGETLSRSYFDQYIAEGIPIPQIAAAFTPEELSDAFLSSASPEELNAAYRAKQSCPN